MRDGWVEYKFKDVATAVKGKLPKNKNEDGIGIPYLTANFLRSSKPDYWIENIEGAVTAEDGDCLILWDGAGAGDLFSAHRGVVSSTMAVVTTQNSKILREFLTLFISSKAEYIKETCRGTTVPHVSPDAIANMDLKIPPLLEQKRIVDLISSVDSYIEALQQKLENAKKSRSSLLHDMLTASGDGWVETTLDEIAYYINGYPFKPADLGEVGLPVIRIKQLLDPYEPVDRTQTSTPDRCLLSDGDIVFSWSGTLAVRIWNRGPAKLNQHLFRVVEKKGVNKGIIPLILDHAIKELEKKSHGTTMKHITKQTLLPHKIHLPPLVEQKRIVEIMLLMDDVVQKSEFAFNQAKDLRSGLLSDLLSGEHEIPSSYDKVIGAA